MPRCDRHDDEGSVVLALLLVLTLGGLSLALLAATVSHISSAERDKTFTGAAPVGDAGIGQGLLVLNSGGVPPSSSQALTQSGRTTDWSGTAVVDPTFRAPTSYTLSSTTRDAGRQFRAEAVQGRRFAVAAFADRSIVFNGSNSADSYNSRTGTTNATGRGRVGSNGSVTLHGASTTVDGVDLYDWTTSPNAGRCSHSGASTCSTSLVTVPERFDLSSAASTSFIRAELNGCPTTALTSPTTTSTLPAGKSCYSSVKLQGDITIAGPTVLYVSGDVVIEHHLKINYSAGVVPNPSLLQIYLLGTTFNMNNHSTLVAAVYAPLATCRGGAQSNVYGSLVCGTIANTGGWGFHYDEALGAIGDGQFRLYDYREG